MTRQPRREQPLQSAWREELKRWTRPRVVVLRQVRKLGYLVARPLGVRPLSFLRRAICSVLREGLALVADAVGGWRAGHVIGVVPAKVSESTRSSPAIVVAPKKT